MNETELKPCPFTGKKPDLYVYDVGDGYEGKITVDGIDFAIYFDGRSKEEVKKELFNFWNTRVYPPKVQEAIEKQKPKKPTNKQIEGIGNCPVCKHTVLYQLGYCSFCGQKLDWSE